MHNFEAFSTLLRRLPEYDALLGRLRSGEKVGSLGAMQSARALIAATLVEDRSGSALIVTATNERARELIEELLFWRSSGTYLFPAPEVLPFERIPWGEATVGRRMRVLASLLQGGDETQVVVTSAPALLTPLPPPATVRERLLVLRPGREQSLSSLAEYLSRGGYRAEAVVEVPGTFSRRGGILDVYPVSADGPVRIDFFGDMIDSLRWFDAQTQRSLGVASRVLLTPASEASAGMSPDSVAQVARLDCQGCHAAASVDLESDKEDLVSGVAPRAFGLYLGYLYPRPATLLDYLGPGAMVLVDDLLFADEAAADLWQQAEESRSRGEGVGDIPVGLKSPLLEWEPVREALTAKASAVLGQGLDHTDSVLGPRFRPVPRMAGQVRVAIEEMVKAAEAGGAVAVTRQADRFAEMLRDRGIPGVTQEAIAEPIRGLQLVEATYPEGWALDLPDGSRVSLITDTEIFGWSRPPRRQARGRRRPEVSTIDVEPGDLVVHVEHGIGRYAGLTRLALDGVEKEYLEIEYAGSDRLYVPTYQVDRISRYVGSGDSQPSLSGLAGMDWQEAKSRARRAVEEIADELLELYATRSMVRGHAFAPDDTWQHELEAAFPYEETEDQLRTLGQVKADMERPRPMDRLICGDVGYGKTEVALRAAFKAVTNGKQVAILVPTTVLAQQHFDTFQRRLAIFPVTVEMLSRFRSDKQQDEVLERLKRGEVDIVVGTHRLIQKDVQFKDLGLVIVDEEQRFGVRHKEHLKKLRKEVDVLTMTATPIPRTLHMALSGLRDMSTIDTPPEDRLAVWTQVSQWDDSLVQRAIRRELARGGQVFVVHDRVMGIEGVANRLRNLVPEARIATAHGQLPEGKLSSVMGQFSGGLMDVLVCTTIIESGLDIPNANTIIINHADRFGLAQLYQLRGRVGRGTVRAYAYLLFSPGQGLTEVARQRLRAIMEASELGSGLQIAMRDLEIRGAGDMLGRRQSGQIAAVGFDLYTRLLAQAIAERRVTAGEADVLTDDVLEAFLRPLRPSLQLNLPLKAELPEDYVTEAGLRLSLYRQLGQLQDEEDVNDFEEELRDRFGPVPEGAQGLLYQTRVKVLGDELGVTAIGREDEQFYIRMDTSRLTAAELREALPGMARLGRGQVWLDASRIEDWRALLLWSLRSLVEIVREKPGHRRPDKRKERASLAPSELVLENEVSS